MKSLSSYLFKNNLSKERLCKLICKSERTLRRYENDPPSWVVNIIEEFGNKKAIPKSWDGWYFDDGFLFDSDGNGFQKDEIRGIFMTRQLSRNLIGDTGNVVSLKNELEEKLKLLDSTITINLENSGEVLKSWKVSI